MSRYNNIPVFIINMPNRLERKEHMKSLMNQLGFTNYTFVVPYSADENTKKLFEEEIKKPFNLSLGKASHNMTYLSLLKLQNIEEMIILEDDIVMTKALEHMKQELDILVNNHPVDSDMIYMEMCLESCSMNKVDSFVKLENPMCTAAIYYPSKKSRDYLVDLLINELDFSNLAMDTAFNQLINSGIINAYMHKLLFVQDNNFGTDLEGSMGYGEEYKPMLPTCQNVEQTIDYFNMENFNDKVKDMYERELSYQIEKLKCDIDEINIYNRDENNENNENNSRLLVVIIIILVIVIMILGSLLLEKVNYNINNI